MVRPQQLLDFPICQLCEEKGTLNDGVEVDHIIPLEVGGEPFESSNLQTLCKRCHVIKSAEEARQRSKGLPLADRDPARENSMLRMNAVIKKERIATRGY